MTAISKNQLLKLSKEQNLLGNDYLVKNIKSASYDLRIGTIYKNSKIYSKDHKDIKRTIEVKPSEIVTLLTLEVVNIPKNCVGTVFAVNGMSSIGFLILNPGHIDPGYCGPISICAINLSNRSIHLNLGQSIFTLVLNKLDKELSDEDAYQNNFYEKNDRKSYELKLFKNKFSKLSNSFFDLIAKHKDGSILLQNILKQLLKKWGFFIFKIITLISAIYGGLRLIDNFTEYPIFGSSETKEMLRRKDSIIKEQKKQLNNQLILNRPLKTSKIDTSKN